MLTGAHSAEVKTTNGKVYPITLIVAEDKEADIIRASVNLPVESVYPLSVSSSIPEVGERVAVIGSPLGLERTVSDGIVSAVREIPAFGKIYQITAPISPGSSGSPVVNMKGEVIGVATFQFVEGQNLNFAIPGERIAKLKTEKGKTLKEREADQREEEERLATAEKFYVAGRLSFLAAEIGSHEKNDYKKALTYFEEAVKKNPRYVEAYFYIGLCNSKLEHYVEAIDAFNQAIRIKPDYAEAHNNLGLAYVKLGRYTEAIAAYKQAIRIKPDFSEAHDMLGMAYYKLGRYREAIDAYKQAIRIKPDNPFAYYSLGMVYWIIGDKSSALDQYKILKNLDNDLANQLFNLIYK